MTTFRSSSYPRQTKPLNLLQEYAANAYLFMFSIWAAIMYVLLARHLPLLWPGIGGIFAILILSNFFGSIKARAKFVEIGFSEEFFYMASVYDIAFRTQVEYYPLTFANIAREGASLFVNYKGQIIRIKLEEWKDFEEIFQRFIYRPPMPVTRSPLPDTSDQESLFIRISRIELNVLSSFFITSGFDIHIASVISSSC